MPFSHTIGMCLFALLAAPAPQPAAEEYPARMIHIVVPYAAGGPVDFIARLIGQKLREAWGRPVIVENYPGAGGNIGTQRAARAAADGYTFAFVSTAFVVNPSLYKGA